jgi:hypothetical protein
VTGDITGQMAPLELDGCVRVHDTPLGRETMDSHNTLVGQRVRFTAFKPCFCLEVFLPVSVKDRVAEAYAVASVFRWAIGS